MPDLRDIINPAALIAVVRQLTFPEFTLADEFPRRSRNTIDYQFERGANPGAIDAAGYRAFDAESPIGRRAGITRVKGQLPPVSRKIPLTEQERLMLESLRNDPFANQGLIDGVFNDAASMTRAVEARLELARGDALVDGIITINENGLQFTIDYGVPNTHKVVAATLWNAGGATIIADLRAWVLTYTIDNGFPPDHALTSTRVFNTMLQDAGIRALVASFQVGGPGIVTPVGLQQILQAFGLPPMRTNDTLIRDLDGGTQRVLPDNRVVFLPPAGQLGATQYGSTVEALELANEGLIQATDVPGLTAVAWKDVDPVAVWTKSVGIALPVMQNPTALFSAQVL